MIKRTLYFSQQVHLSTHQRQLVVGYPDGTERKVPIEDIGIVVLEHHSITLSHTLMAHLLGNNAAIITCDAHHLPQGLLLNLNGHTEQQEHFRVQLEATEAQKAKCWQQTVQAKIRNQAGLLRQNGLDTENMERWASKTKPGDPDNFEARAAAFYWRKLFIDHLQDFRRGRFEGEPNNLLNYGYAILRATVARALVASGLLPTLGYFHRNKYNAYALADDVMEPYRPYVDELVLELVRSEDDYSVLTPAIKQKLLQIPVLDVNINDQRSPLMLAVQQSTSSLYKCYARELKSIKFPKL
jgi:CRISP-associated protein Cas1